MRPWLKEKSLQRHLHVRTLHCNKCLVVLCVLTDFPFGHDLRMLVQVYLVVDLFLCWLLWTRLYGSVVRAVDCRSADPWFNSGWKSWFTFMTCSDNPMNQISQMFISKSPITRNSVKTSSFEKYLSLQLFRKKVCFCRLFLVISFIWIFPVSKVSFGKIVSWKKKLLLWSPLDFCWIFLFLAETL